MLHKHLHHHTKRNPLLAALAAICTAALIVLFVTNGATIIAQARSIFLELESGTQTNVTRKSDNNASGGKYIQFDRASDSTPAPTPAPEPEPEPEPVGGLPSPINPGDRDFGRIVRQTKPNGGVIVLPDGDYTVSDVSGFNPSDYVVVVAQNRNKARVVRSANIVGQTDQYFSNSSKLIFVGLDFKNIQTRFNGGSDIYFWQTKHGFPIETHPDPTETYCGNGKDPTALGFYGGMNRVGLFGSVIDGAGHDGLKLASINHLTARGIKITNVTHGGLQEGRGNSRCGWDGNDNYHDDGIQIYPGGVNNFTLEQSYVGRQQVLQVDSGGSSNNNLVFKNNMFYQEPPSSGCLAINARVKDSAQSGATQTMTFQNNDAWCSDSQWVFYVSGSRNNAMVINGDQISSSQREANKYLTRRTGTPNTNNTPSETWRSNNPYNDWACYLDNAINDFSQNIDDSC